MIPAGTEPDDQHDRQALIGIVDTAAHGGAEEPGDDPRPVAPVEKEQGPGGPEVEDREHRHERGVCLAEIQPDQRRHHDGVAERRHGKELGDALEGGKKQDQTCAQHRQSLPSHSRVLRRVL